MAAYFMYEAEKLSKITINWTARVQFLAEVEIYFIITVPRRYWGSFSRGKAI
jgi:hypothetical protein